MAKTFLISAGHSRKDPGAVGNGFTEAYLALELRDRVAEKIRERGASVIEDGADGENLPLRDAVKLARGVDVAIEFHWNAGPPAATGIEVLSKPDKKSLAKQIAWAIHQTTNLKLRGDAGWKSDSSGQHHRLAFCEAGGLIVEVCFISSKVDMAAYTSAKDAVAENIAYALTGIRRAHTSSAAVPAEAPLPSISADAPAADPPNPPENTQPPIITETTTTDAVQTGSKVHAVATTEVQPKGDTPDVPATKVTTNGPLSKWLAGGGGLTALGTFVWGYIQSNPSAVAIGILCVTLLIVVIIFRGAITDAIRMQTSADPDKKNVT